MDPLGEQVAAVRKVQERINHDRPHDFGYGVENDAVRWYRTLAPSPWRHTTPRPAVRRQTQVTERATIDEAGRGSLIKDNVVTRMRLVTAVGNVHVIYGYFY